MYAIVETGGKQYRVEAGSTIEVEKLPVAVGETVRLDRVLLVAEGDSVTVGKPTVDGAHVEATVTGQRKSRKVVIYKYRPRQRYRLKKGHRQPYSSLRIDSIKVA